MPLTRDEITAGASYTVRLARDLSSKRKGDALKLVKGIGGQRETHVYDPAHPDAHAATGFRRNDDPACATSRYNPVTRTWAVTIPAAGGHALSALRSLADAYDAAVEPDDGSHEEQEPPKLTYRRTRDGEWAVFGPASLLREGLVAVSKKDGSVRTENISRLGRIFTVGGAEYRYGYIAAPEPGRRRVPDMDMREYGSGFGPDEMG